MRFHHVAGFVLAIACSILSARAQSLEPGQEPRIPDSDVFAARITEQTVDEFIAKHPPGSLTRIGLFSLGGDLTASIRFARWIKQNNLDVVVRNVCHSGCANYVFVAGKNKFIEPNSVVVWHGSAEQKDVRELQDRYETLEARFKSDPSSVSAEDREYLEKFHDRYLYIERQRNLQREFFEEVGVDEMVTRLGQEPVDYGIDGWAATVDAMKRYGIDHVSAPQGYGTIQYMRHNALLATLEEGKLLSFDVDESGQPIASQAVVKFMPFPGLHPR